MRTDPDRSMILDIKFKNAGNICVLPALSIRLLAPQTHHSRVLSNRLADDGHFHTEAIEPCSSPMRDTQPLDACSVSGNLPPKLEPWTHRGLWRRWRLQYRLVVRSERGLGRLAWLHGGRLVCRGRQAIGRYRCEGGVGEQEEEREEGEGPAPRWGAHWGEEGRGLGGYIRRVRKESWGQEALTSQ